MGLKCLFSKLQPLQTVDSKLGQPKVNSSQYYRSHQDF